MITTPVENYYNKLDDVNKLGPNGKIVGYQMLINIVNYFQFKCSSL